MESTVDWPRGLLARYLGSEFCVLLLGSFGGSIRFAVSRDSFIGLVDAPKESIRRFFVFPYDLGCRGAWGLRPRCCSLVILGLC